MALFGAKWRFSGMVQGAVPVHSAAEVDDGEAFVSAFAPRRHALLLRERRFYSTFSGAYWRFWGMAQVQRAAEVDDGGVFVSFSPRERLPARLAS
jgi:hypothetical protein